MCTGLSSCLNQTLPHKVCLIPLFSLLDQTENTLISMATWDWVDATEARTLFHPFKSPRRYRCRLDCWQQSWKDMPQSHAGHCAITTSLALVPELALSSFWVADTARCRHCLLSNPVRVSYLNLIVLIVSVKVQAHFQQGAAGSLAWCALTLPEACPSSICSTLHAGTQISYLSQFHVMKPSYQAQLLSRKPTYFLSEMILLVRVTEVTNVVCPGQLVWWHMADICWLCCELSFATWAVCMALTTALMVFLSICLLLFNYYLWTLKKKKTHAG